MLTVDQILEIKAKLKKEMLRRGLNNSTSSFGSLSEYGEDKYDFNVTPSPHARILQEHGEKTINILYRVEDQKGCDYVKDESKIPGDNNFGSLNSYIDNLATENMEGGSSSCRGACSGLCFGSCIGNCYGCSGKCDTGCVGCVATCGTGCESGLMR